MYASGLQFAVGIASMQGNGSGLLHTWICGVVRLRFLEAKLPQDPFGVLVASTCRWAGSSNLVGGQTDWQDLKSLQSARPDGSALAEWFYTYSIVVCA